MLMTDMMERVDMSPRAVERAEAALANGAVTIPYLRDLPATKTSLEEIALMLRVERETRRRWYILQRLLRRASAIRTTMEQRALLKGGRRAPGRGVAIKPRKPH